MALRNEERKPGRSVSVTGLHKRVGVLERKVNNHADRIGKLEDSLEIIQALPELLTSIKKWVKIWGPIIATAALTSGVVKGPLADFLDQIFKAIGAS